MIHAPKKQKELQHQSKMILNSLKGIQVPANGLDHFTVGDHFRECVINLHKEILKLPDSDNNSLEKIIVGDFGTGKTHFLNYLAWLLEHDAPSDCIISKVDLSDLRSPHDFQFKIIQNMQPIKGGNYSDVLSNSYLSIRDHYFDKNYKIGEDSIQKLYGLILFSLLGNLSQGWVREDILSLLNVKQPIDRILNTLSGNTLQKMFEQDRTRSDKSSIDFVEAYLELIKNPKSPISKFEVAAKQLAYKGTLIDVMFKTLAHSGVKMVVILVDELESLARFNDLLKESLTVLRDFRDTFNKSYDEFGYPAIAFVCASTDGFFYETLKRQEPALFSRWDLLDNTLLRSMSQSDIDNLIFSLRELHYLAGYKLNPIKNYTDDGTHDLITMRNRVMEKLSDSDISFSSRKLIKNLLDEIEETWIC